MNPHDIARAAADYELHKRALAACLVAGTAHLARYEDIPCTRHLLDVASSLVTDGPATASTGLDGVAGCRVPAIADDGITDAEPARPAAPPRVGRTTAPPRFDEDDEWDANGMERVPTWERKPGRI